MPKRPRVRMSAKVKQTDPKAFVSIFKQGAEIAAKKTAMSVAEAIAEEAVEILETQRYNWAPLKPGTVAAKKEAGLDPRTLIATEEYKNAIQAWEEDGLARVGVPDHLIHKSGLPMTILARIHEFGTKTIPARQLWRPLLSKYKREKKRFARIYEQNLKKTKKKLAALKKTKKKIL